MSRGRWSWSALAVLIFSVPMANAQWTAHQWGPGGSWNPAGNREIHILAPGTYKFYVTDGGPNGSLADIRGVFVDPNVPSGTVTVHIARDPNTGGGPGVSELGTIALSAASDSIVAECRVAAGGS